MLLLTKDLLGEGLKPDIDGVESRLEAASEMRATHRDAINYLISRDHFSFFLPTINKTFSFLFLQLSQEEFREFGICQCILA